MCEWWPLFRQGLKDVSWGWSILRPMTFTAWVLSLVVERSCTFVEIETADGLYYFGRGTTRGRLRPNDVCQSWFDYSTLELDLAALSALVAAILSIAVGPFVWGYLLISVCCQPFPWFFKWIIVTACVMLSGLQAMTHTMTKSILCGDMYIVQMDQLVYDTCSKDTLTYNVTFVAVGLWIAAAVLFSVLGLHNTKRDHEDEEVDHQHVVEANQQIETDRHVGANLRDDSITELDMDYDSANLSTTEATMEDSGLNRTLFQ